MVLVGVITGLHYLFMVPLLLLSIFLILVILVQRGRGGGLTGALGGMGGQSAFGTKAGDLFTRITIVIAAIWVLLSMGALKILNNQATTGGYDPRDVGRATSTSPLNPQKGDAGKTAPASTPSAEKADSAAEQPAPSAPAPGQAESAAPPASAPPAEAPATKGQ
jgi:preprotein translocase subunit SecG